MKHLLGILLAASMATAGYAQDPETNFSKENGDYNYNNYSDGSAKGSSQDKFDANSGKDMNNTMDMNNPLYLENSTKPRYDQNAEVNSNVGDKDPYGSKAGNALDKAGDKSKKGISKGWDKVKHNKVTKHLFNQPRNS
jgi:hypothetical protein